MRNIYWNITVTGTEEAGRELAQKLNGEVVDAQTQLEIHKQREMYALADDNPYEDSDIAADPKMHSDQLWQQHNWGIHPSSLKEGGFAFRVKVTESPSEEKCSAILIIRALSAEHPNLHFDALFVNRDENAAGILLVKQGEVVLFSPITDEDFNGLRDEYASIGEAKGIEMDDDITDPDDIKEIHFATGLIWA